MRVFVTGDTHGSRYSFKELKSFAINEDLLEDDVIIIAGDAGIYYGGQTYGDARRLMGQSRCSFLILRGNHDDRIQHVIESSSSMNSWSEQEILGNTSYVHKNYPNIHYALDQGGLYSINNKKVLLVPGAYSVDKYYRLAQGYPYNPFEQLTKKEMSDLLDLAEKNQDITGVVAHTAPLSWEAYFRDLFLDGLNQSAIDKTTDKFLDELIGRLPNLKHYYFGHFHDDRNCGRYGVMLYREIVEYGEKLDNGLDVYEKKVAKIVS